MTATVHIGVDLASGQDATAIALRDSAGNFHPIKQPNERPFLLRWFDARQPAAPYFRAQVAQHPSTNS